MYTRLLPAAQPIPIGTRPTLAEIMPGALLRPCRNAISSLALVLLSIAVSVLLLGVLEPSAL